MASTGRSGTDELDPMAEIEKDVDDAMITPVRPPGPVHHSDAPIGYLESESTAPPTKPGDGPFQYDGEPPITP